MMSSNLDGLSQAVEQKYEPFSTISMVEVAVRSNRLPQMALFVIQTLNSSLIQYLNTDKLLIMNRKQAVLTQNQELEALEAKLRETEERLKQKQSRSSSPATALSDGGNSPRRRQGLEGVFSSPESGRQHAPTATRPTPTAPTSANVPVSARDTTSSDSPLHQAQLRTPEYSKDHGYDGVEGDRRREKDDGSG